VTFHGHLAGRAEVRHLDGLLGIVDAVDQERDELADRDAKVLGVVDAEARLGTDAARHEAGEPN
jgi:hypothetical protein